MDSPQEPASPQAGQNLRRDLWTTFRNRLQGMSAGQITTAGTVVLLGATAAFGGLEPVEASDQALEPGAAVSGAQRDFVLESVHVTGAVDGLREPECGRRLVVARGTLTITADEADWQPAQDLMLVPPEEHQDRSGDPLEADPDAVLDGADQPDWMITPGQVVLASDGTEDPMLQPGVPARLVFAWEVPDGVYATGDEVELALWDRQLVRDADNGIYVDGWEVAGEAGRYAVPLADPLPSMHESAPGHEFCASGAGGAGDDGGDGA